MPLDRPLDHLITASATSQGGRREGSSRWALTGAIAAGVTVYYLWKLFERWNPYGDDDFPLSEIGESVMSHLELPSPLLPLSESGMADCRDIVSDTTCSLAGTYRSRAGRSRDPRRSTALNESKGKGRMGFDKVSRIAAQRVMGVFGTAAPSQTQINVNNVSFGSRQGQYPVAATGVRPQAFGPLSLSSSPLASATNLPPPILIVFGSESGTAKGYALGLARELELRGCAEVEVLDPALIKYNTFVGWAAFGQGSVATPTPPSPNSSPALGATTKESCGKLKPTTSTSLRSPLLMSLPTSPASASASSPAIETFCGGVLNKRAIVIFITATYGDGGPCANYKGIFEALTQAAAEADHNPAASSFLCEAHVAVFALGSSAYRQFCRVGKVTSECLERLGARMLTPLVCGDSHSTASRPVDDVFDDWQEGLVTAMELLDEKNRTENSRLGLNINIGGLTKPPPACHISDGVSSGTQAVTVAGGSQQGGVVVAATEPIQNTNSTRSGSAPGLVKGQIYHHFLEGVGSGAAELLIRPLLFTHRPNGGPAGGGGESEIGGMAPTRKLLVPVALSRLRFKDENECEDTIYPLAMRLAIPSAKRPLRCRVIGKRRLVAELTEANKKKEESPSASFPSHPNAHYATPSSAALLPTSPLSAPHSDDGNESVVGTMRRNSALQTNANKGGNRSFSFSKGGQAAVVDENVSGFCVSASSTPSTAAHPTKTYKFSSSPSATIVSTFAPKGSPPSFPLVRSREETKEGEGSPAAGAAEEKELEDGGELLHMSFDISHSLGTTYQAGDHLSIYPRNDPALASALLEMVLVRHLKLPAGDQDKLVTTWFGEMASVVAGGKITSNASTTASLQQTPKVGATATGTTSSASAGASKKDTSKPNIDGTTTTIFTTAVGERDNSVGGISSGAIGEPAAASSTLFRNKNIKAPSYYFGTVEGRREVAGKAVAMEAPSLNKARASGHNSFPSRVALKDVFEWYLDVSGPPKRSLLRTMARCCRDKGEREAFLESIKTAQPNNNNNNNANNKKAQLKRIIDYFIEYPSCVVPLDLFLECCPRVQPRRYSIASDGLRHPNEVHIIAKVVQNGLATRYLDRDVGPLSHSSSRPPLDYFAHAALSKLGLSSPNTNTNIQQPDSENKRATAAVLPLQPQNGYPQISGIEGAVGERHDDKSHNYHRPSSFGSSALSRVRERLLSPRLSVSAASLSPQDFPSSIHSTKSLLLPATTELSSVRVPEGICPSASSLHSFPFDYVYAFIAHSDFHLPPAKLLKSRNTLFIGPGTGVAPLLGFVHRRLAIGLNGGKDKMPPSKREGFSLDAEAAAIAEASARHRKGRQVNSKKKRRSERDEDIADDGQANQSGLGEQQDKDEEEEKDKAVCALFVGCRDFEADCAVRVLIETDPLLREQLAVLGEREAMKRGRKRRPLPSEGGPSNAYVGERESPFDVAKFRSTIPPVSLPIRVAVSRGEVPATSKENGTLLSHGRTKQKMNRDSTFFDGREAPSSSSFSSSSVVGEERASFLGDCRAPADIHEGGFVSAPEQDHYNMSRRKVIGSDDFVTDRIPFLWSFGGTTTTTMVDSSFSTSNPRGNATSSSCAHSRGMGEARPTPTPTRVMQTTPPLSPSSPWGFDFGKSPVREAIASPLNVVEAEEERLKGDTPTKEAAEDSRSYSTVVPAAPRPLPLLLPFSSLLPTAETEGLGEDYYSSYVLNNRHASTDTLAPSQCPPPPAVGCGPPLRLYGGGIERSAVDDLANVKPTVRALFLGGSIHAIEEDEGTRRATPTPTPVSANIHAASSPSLSSSPRRNYVQTLLRQEGQFVLDNFLLNPDGCVYICGDALRMAKDVRSAFLEMLMTGGMSQQSAEAHLEAMEKQGRYLQDIW